MRRAGMPLRRRSGSEMKRMLSLSGLALVLATGCQTSAPVAQADPTLKNEPVQQIQGGERTGGAIGGTIVKQDPEEAQKTRTDNPYRIHQLGELEKIKATVGEHTFWLFVMDTNTKRQEGMMFLKDNEVKENEGMVFVFPDAAPRRFWMRNTLIPLDGLYVGKDRRILNIVNMKPLDEVTDYSSAGDAMYVIELKAGTSQRLGIRKGQTVTFSVPIKAKE